MTLRFTDYQLQEIAKDTGLSKLELLGVIAAMNKHLPTSEQLKRREEDERMGRDI
jgi:hypothetical protein